MIVVPYESELLAQSAIQTIILLILIQTFILQVPYQLTTKRRIKYETSTE